MAAPSYGGGRTSQFWFPAGALTGGDGAIALLRASLRSWFDQHKEGQECEIQWFPHRDGLLIRVSRGRVITTVARWQENLVRFELFRPAIEDVIVYDPKLSVSRFLDHSSLAVTTVYLRRLEGQEDKSWAKVAAAIGV